MTDDYRALLKATILSPDFVSATFSGVVPGQMLHWRRLLIRPVLLKATRHLQLSYFDDKKDFTRNYAGEAAGEAVDEALALPFRNFMVQTQPERIQVNISKQGKAIVSRHAQPQPVTVDLAHNREKNKIIPEGVPLPFLTATGMATPDGRVKADMRNKFRQMNEFLRLLAETGELERFDHFPLEVVDFGCGSAHLTFAVYHYLNHVLNVPARVTGVDLKADLIQRHNQTAARLGWREMHFVACSISEYQAENPADIVIALHACDTATDDAIAQGIIWRSKLILCAPCCHHYLQAQMDTQPAPLAPLLRYGLFQERLGDLLTDTFRAQILRIQGYQVDVAQLVPAEHTPKNVLVRAVRTADTGDRQQVQDYLALKDYWHVTPYLHPFAAISLVK